MEVVYLTTAPKHDLPTHVVIRSAPKVSTALCEQITSVSTSRIGSYIGIITEMEMRQIDSAMLISLDLWLPADDEEEDGGMEETQHCIGCEEGDTESRDGSRDLTAAIAERDVYRELYEQLLDKVVAG